MPNTQKPELIVMLTHNDLTVKNAFDVFEACKDTKPTFWGFKEEGIPLSEKKELFTYMKSLGKKTFLEVVAYTEKECLDGAKLALECGCDVLMGTIYADSINELCLANRLKYMPFVGDVTERPSILNGTIDGMIAEAKDYLKKGVYGFDLLGYRYTGNATELNRRFTAEVDAPVCIAGSIDSYRRLDEIKEADPWAFTVGSAFFEGRFNGSIAEQINSVYDHIHA